MKGYVMTAEITSRTNGTLALAKEEQCHYATPPLDSPVSTVNIGVDGTTIYLC